MDLVGNFHSEHYNFAVVLFVHRTLLLLLFYLPVLFLLPTEGLRTNSTTILFKSGD